MSLVNKAVVGVASEHGGGGSKTGVHTKQLFIARHFSLTSAIDLWLGSLPVGR